MIKQSECTCKCHEPGATILHCIPCCKPDRVLILSEGVIRNNWEFIKNDEYFYAPDCESPDDFIERVKRGEVLVGGAKLVIQNKLPGT